MPKGLSLHIGLNTVDPAHYGGWDGKLQACEADHEEMAALAKSKGFKTTALTSKKATRKAVMGAIADAAKTLKAGDIFLVTYAGHGGQVPDKNGDEADLKDETWCLFDGQLVDDELNELWAKFAKDVRILAILDSCHSGSAVRAAYNELARTGVTSQPVTRTDGDQKPVFRTMPDDAAARTYRLNRAFYDDIAADLPEQPSPIVASLRLISGCQDNQLSMDGTFNGLFTGTLLRVWKNGDFGGNYDKFHQEIVRLMPPTQSPNHLKLGTPSAEYDGQTPFSI